MLNHSPPRHSAPLCPVAVEAAALAGFEGDSNGAGGGLGSEQRQRRILVRRGHVLWSI